MPEDAAVQAAAAKVGIDVDVLAIRRAADHCSGFRGSQERDAGALRVSGCAGKRHLHSHHTLALGARLPTIHASREFIAAAGLISYGADYADMFRHAADFVDKILKGAKPADLPIEQTTKFELVINLTTAKALGLNIPELSSCAPTR